MTNDADTTRTAESNSMYDYGARLMFGAVALVLMFSAPAAAQSAICDGQASIISEVINAVIQLSVFIGMAGLGLTYMATNAAEALPISQDTREKVKDQRRKAYRGAAGLVFGGPLLFIVISQTSVPWADCIQLIPF